MSIQPDRWIREQALQGMIEPFEDRLVRNEGNVGVISYGLSSFGYDLRAAPEWRIFVNAFNTVVDPKNFDTNSLIEVDGDTCIIPPNSFALTRSVEYMRVPEDVMVVALGKSSYARCFSGDTRVALVDGTSVSLEKMADRYLEGERFFGYSLGRYGRVIVTHLDAPRFIGRDNLVEVVLDNGEPVHCTPDHLFITRDGRSVAAAELRPNDSLMPLYRNLFRGYEMAYQPLTGYYSPTHRLADEWNLSNGIYEDVANTHCHHLDHDRQNNDPRNIVRMDAGEHIRYHNAETYGYDFDSEAHGAAIRDALSRLGQDPVWRERFNDAQRQRALAFWHDEDYAGARADLTSKHRNFWQSADARRLQAERQRDFWTDNEQARSSQGERSQRAWAESGEARRNKQRDVARGINLREDIDAAAVRAALDLTGSIRGAARALHCDRSVFRRFPEVVQAFKGHAPQNHSQNYPENHPRNHKVTSVKTLRGEHDVYCLTVPEAGNFALEAGVFIHNCGIVANVTPLEPGWEGHVTLELSNTTPLPAKVYANEGIVQLLFFQGERPEVTYKDRSGKYQGQRGVTLPRL
ncbi:hypothetical protein BH24DEI2_BH24DEI2_05950 [soil metagenome]